MNSKTAIVCLALGVAIVCLTECTSGANATASANNTTTVSPVAGVTLGGVSNGSTYSNVSGVSGPTANTTTAGNNAGRFAVPSLFTMMSIVCAILYGVNNQF